MELKYDESLVKENKERVDNSFRKVKWRTRIITCALLILCCSYGYIACGILEQTPRSIGNVCLVAGFMLLSIATVVSIIFWISLKDRLNYEFPERFYQAAADKTLLEIFLDSPWEIGNETFLSLHVVAIGAHDNISRTSVGRIRMVERKGIDSSILDINESCFIVPYKMRDPVHPYPFDDISLHWENPAANKKGET